MKKKATILLRRICAYSFLYLGEILIVWNFASENSKYLFFQHKSLWMILLIAFLSVLLYFAINRLLIVKLIPKRKVVVYEYLLYMTLIAIFVAFIVRFY